MINVPESHRDLLRAEVAVLATVGRDGTPQVTAVWFLLDDDGEVRLSLNTSRQKVRNLRERPRCALFILDPGNPYRTLEIRARAEVTPDDDYAFADKVGKRYGADLRAHDRPGETRVTVTLHPIRINAINMRGEG